MKEGTWLVHRWRMDCPACNARVEEEAAYCPNCGKWLGVVRRHAWMFLLIAFWCLAVGGSCLLVSKFVGDRTAVPLVWAATIFFIASTFPVLAVKPFGLRLLWWEGKKRRAKEWNAEVVKRQKEERAEEDRAERERSANAKAERRKKRFPLMAGSGFTQTLLGTIEVNSEGPIRAQIDEGWGSLHYFENAEGVIENFFLEPIPAEPKKKNEALEDLNWRIAGSGTTRRGSPLERVIERSTRHGKRKIGPVDSPRDGRRGPGSDP